jgi:hypothetical protein
VAAALEAAAAAWCSARVSSCSHSPWWMVFVHPDTAPLHAGSSSSAYRLLSDQLSNYGVDVPYIQAYIHGLNSRSILDLDDSPTVLRDEGVAGG